MLETIAKVSHLNVYYGKLHAVKDVSFEVREGEIVSLIGANGAGKTSTLLAIAGLLRSITGDIEFLGKRINDMEAFQRVRLGLSLVTEARGLFSNLTVLENLIIGSYVSRANKKDGLERVFGLFPILKERSHQKAGKLSGGEQKMLIIGRALMSNPKLLLLDEVSLGLAPLIVRELYRTIEKINSEGVTILFVEQNARIALKTAHRVYVLENGRISRGGIAEELFKEDSLRRAYLGV